MSALDQVATTFAIGQEARRIALEEAEARIRAIPISVQGPDGHPDTRIAQRAAEAAEAMRRECIRALRGE